MTMEDLVVLTFPLETSPETLCLLLQELRTKLNPGGEYVFLRSKDGRIVFDNSPYPSQATCLVAYLRIKGGRENEWPSPEELSLARRIDGGVLG